MFMYLANLKIQQCMILNFKNMKQLPVIYLYIMPVIIFIHWRYKKLNKISFYSKNQKENIESCLSILEHFPLKESSIDPTLITRSQICEIY